MILLFVYLPGYSSLVYSPSLSWFLHSRKKLFIDLWSRMLHLDYNIFILQQSIEFLSALVFQPPQHPVAESTMSHMKKNFLASSVCCLMTPPFSENLQDFKKMHLTWILCNKEGIFPGSYWLTTGTQFEQCMLYQIHPFSNLVAGIL